MDFLQSWPNPRTHVKMKLSTVTWSMTLLSLSSLPQFLTLPEPQSHGIPYVTISSPLLEHFDTAYGSQSSRLPLVSGLDQPLACVGIGDECEVNEDCCQNERRTVGYCDDDDKGTCKDSDPADEMPGKPGDGMK